MPRLTDTASDAASNLAGEAGRLLLICSHFFSYNELIAAQLRQMGYDVVVWDDRVFHTTLYKLLLRKLSLLTGLATARVYIDKAKLLPQGSLDQILIVKGEGLSRPVLSFLRSRFPQARIGLFLWDAVTNTRNSRRIAPFADYVYTFDPDDARQYGWHYRPLFAKRDDGMAYQQSKYDWSFVGTIHSDRARVIRRFRAAVSPARRGFVFGYVPSRLLYLMHLVRDPRIAWEAPGAISLAPMPSAAATRVISSSRAVLDIEHPTQIGLTMRSIETLLSGRKLITTNRTMLDSPLYHPSRVCVIDRANPIVPDRFFDDVFETIPDEVAHAHSLAGWADEVLGRVPALV
ncbi:hypothetical protein KQX64_20950 [Rhodopseudomonas palustris]|nr:hypothetical protein KQX64_20950 [Rhodopseudomonas palustris]